MSHLMLINTCGEEEPIKTDYLVVSHITCSFIIRLPVPGTVSKENSILASSTYTEIYRSRNFQDPLQTLRTLFRLSGPYQWLQLYEKLNPQTSLVETLPALV